MRAAGDTERAITDHVLSTLMSDYDVRPGGSLKLKGVAEGGIVKK